MCRRKFATFLQVTWSLDIKIRSRSNDSNFKERQGPNPYLISSFYSNHLKPDSLRILVSTCYISILGQEPKDLNNPRNKSSYPQQNFLQQLAPWRVPHHLLLMIMISSRPQVVSPMKTYIPHSTMNQATTLACYIFPFIPTLRAPLSQLLLSQESRPPLCRSMSHVALCHPHGLLPLPCACLFLMPLTQELQYRVIASARLPPAFRQLMLMHQQWGNYQMFSLFGSTPIFLPRSHHTMCTHSQCIPNNMHRKPKISFPGPSGLVHKPYPRPKCL